MTLTKNTEKLRQEVAAHVAADSIVQGNYWNSVSKRGCFIGCLAKGNNPEFNKATYGLPVMLQRIAENIFGALPADEAKAFFAALPDAVSCDGKDLTKVSWQFLAAELRSLPEQPAEVQAVIDPVIIGMDLLANGQEWPETARAAWAAWAAARDAEDTDWTNAARAARSAEWAATAAKAAQTVAWTATSKAALAAACATASARSTEWASAAAAARLRQRDLLLRLIAEAPVVENHQ